MKYQIKKTANIYKMGKNNALIPTKDELKSGSIVDGIKGKAIFLTGNGYRQGVAIQFSSNHSKYINAFNAIPVNKPVDDKMSFSGQEAVNKIGGVDFLIPVGVFAGLGLAIGSIVGENRVNLTLGGAILGGLIGASNKMK